VCSGSSPSTASSRSHFFVPCPAVGATRRRSSQYARSLASRPSLSFWTDSLARQPALAGWLSCVSLVIPSRSSSASAQPSIFPSPDIGVSYCLCCAYTQSRTQVFLLRFLGSHTKSKCWFFAAVSFRYRIWPMFAIGRLSFSCLRS
jgi:hypothetical protein